MKIKLFKKRNVKINEMINRRDEVISRAAMIANRNIPQSLIDEPLPKILEWIVAPHLYEAWEKHVNVSLKEVRHDQQLVYKILGTYAEKKIKNKEVNQDEENIS